MALLEQDAHAVTGYCFKKQQKIYENHKLDNIGLEVGCPIALQTKIVVLVRKCLFLKVFGALPQASKFLKLLYSKPAATTVAYSFMTREANAM